MPKRVQYIDIAKGIGILLVVLGHNDMNAYHPMLHRFIYAFHMALFFFLSGIFFNPDRDFKTLFKKRFAGLIKPLIFSILLIYGISVFFGKMSFITAGGRILKSLYMTGPYLNWVQLWFLPLLFLVNLYAFFFYKFTKSIKKDWIRWIILLITLWIGTLYLPYMWTLDIELFGKSLSLYGMPANVDLILLAGFYFILAREAYRALPESFFASKITFFASALVLFTMVFTLDIPVDFNMRLYTSLTLNTIEAVAGIIFILSFSKKIEQYSSRLTSIFSYIGGLTLSILVFHVPIQEMVNNKLNPFMGQSDLTIFLAYLAGVLGPIFIHEFFIAPNPRVGAWFGMGKQKSS
ncbi:MAG: acyltransferase family protein [Anaerolineae bacterium]|jgi:polysaccharide biosynthesis protein PslL|nr:acyltransferase family protein [Anaerolineae bacterium]MBT7073439.1 acyltransferase family protein [Anaerolineae bacterium]MBT7781812.1 acyltransferase family protein [Anaerolineae bacterium]